MSKPNNTKPKTEKKAFLNVSKREKNILMIIGAVAVLSGIYFFAIEPALAENTRVSEELTVAKEKFNETQLKLSKKAELEQKVQALKFDTLAQAQAYYGNTNQGEFIYLIDSLLKQSNLDLKTVRFDEPELTLWEESEEESSGSDSAGVDGNSSGESTAATATADSAANNSSADTTEPGTQTIASQSEAINASKKAEEKPVQDYSGVSLMTAEIEFEGTYAQVHSFLTLVTANDQKIVSSELEMTVPELGRPDSEGNETNDTKLSGKVLLRFYQVTDVAKYVPAPESQVDKTQIPLSTFDSPFQRYSWAKLTSTAQTGASSGVGTSSGLTGTAPSVAPSLTGNLSQIPSYSGGTYLPPVLQNQGQSNIAATMRNTTIYSFEKEKPLLIADGKGEISAVVDYVDKQEGAASTQLQFKSVQQNRMIQVDLSDEKISINRAPESLSFDLFRNSNEATPKDKLALEVGLKLSDNSGSEVYLKVLDQIAWTGWKTVSFNLSEVKSLSYPYTVKSVYFIYHENSEVEDIIKIDRLSIKNIATN